MGSQRQQMESWGTPGFDHGFMEFFCLHLKNKLQTKMMILLLVRYSHFFRLDSFPTMDFFMCDSHGSVPKLPVTLSQTPGEDSPHNLFMPSAEKWRKMGPSKGDDPHF